MGAQFRPDANAPLDRISRPALTICRDPDPSGRRRPRKCEVCMHKGHFRLFALLGGGVVLALSVAGFWLVESKPLDTTWTPTHLALPLSTTTDRREVLVGDVPLEKAIAEKRLTVVTGAGPQVVREATVRVNDSDQLREARFPVSYTHLTLPTIYSV